MLALASLLSVSPLGFSTAPTPEPTPACKTIAELLAETDYLSTLNTAVNANPDVLAVLADPAQNLTVFAPNDDAFLPLDPYLDEILGDLDLLSEVLGAHAIFGVATAEDVLARIPGFGEENMINVTTVNEKTIYLGSQAFAPNSVFLGPVIEGAYNGSDPATVVVPNIKACNGIVHVIDMVLEGDDDEDDEGDDDDEGSCVPVRHGLTDPVECDCVEPDNPCLTEDGRGNVVPYGSGTCVPEPSCEDYGSDEWAYYDGVEYQSSDCTGPYTTWSGHVATSEGEAADDCYAADDNSWSTNFDWCDFSGPVPTLETTFFVGSDDCSTPGERYSIVADGITCVDHGDGSSGVYNCMMPEDRRRLRAKKEGKFSTIFEDKHGI